MKDNARSDYTKEYQVKRVLENSNYTPNFLKKYHKKYFDYFIYFQNELEKNDNIQNLLVEKGKIFVEFLYTKE